MLLKSHRCKEKEIQNHLYGELIAMKEMNVRYQNQGNYQLPCIEKQKSKMNHISACGQNDTDNI